MLEPESLDAHELAAGSRLREGDYAGAEYQLARILEMTKPSQMRKTGWGIVTALLAPANDKVRANKVFKNLLVDFEASSDAGCFVRSQSVRSTAAGSGELDQGNRIDRSGHQTGAGQSGFAWPGQVTWPITRQNTDLALQRYSEAWEASPGDPAIAMAYAELLKREKKPVELRRRYWQICPTRRK